MTQALRRVTHRCGESGIAAFENVVRTVGIAFAILWSDEDALD